MATVIATLPQLEPAFAWPVRRPLLSAEWRHLAMLNYEIDPRVLQPLVPAGTELDFWNGAAYVSIVGFQFLQSRLLGVVVPFHANFVEVNLRFYVQRKTRDGWRRGVCFIRELAPRRAVAVVANLLYGERYLTVPMSHCLEPGVGEVPSRVEYAWRYCGRNCSVAIEPDDAARRLEPDSHEQYIAEHYWGYSSLGRGRAKEYLVAHPAWQISPAAATLDCECAAAIYGAQFAECLAEKPISAFWADGSAVRVYPGRRI